MNPINFSIVPRSTMQANNNALFSQQRALGDEYEDAIGDVAKSLKLDQEAKAKAKAQEIEARGQNEWNEPNGMFLGIDNDDEKKARKLASMISPFDPILAREWVKQADQYAQRKIRAGELASDNTRQSVLKNMELDAGLEKARLDKETELAKMSAKEKEAQEKAMKEGLELTENDIKTAISARGSGNYEQFWKLKTNNGTNGYSVTLPKPDTTDADFEKILTKASKGIVAGETLVTDIKQAGVDLQKSQYGLKPAELESVQAQKGINYESGKSLSSSIAPEIRSQVEGKADEYNVTLKSLNETSNYINQIEELIKTQPVNAFKAIATIIAFNKAIDPRSVVKETEFAIAQSATGFKDQVESNVQSYVDGVNLTSTGISSLKEFVEVIKALYKSSVTRLNGWALENAKYYGIPVEAITRNEVPLSAGGKSTPVQTVGQPQPAQPTPVQKPKEEQKKPVKQRGEV